MASIHSYQLYWLPWHHLREIEFCDTSGVYPWIFSMPSVYLKSSAPSIQLGHFWTGGGCRGLSLEALNVYEKSILQGFSIIINSEASEYSTDGDWGIALQCLKFIWSAVLFPSALQGFGYYQSAWLPIFWVRQFCSWPCECIWAGIVDAESSLWTDAVRCYLFERKPIHYTCQALSDCPRFARPP